ncbi:MAG: ParB/RepB/Spo0J family partition protein, partial [Bacteroidota bacterium]
NDNESLVMALVENIQRHDLDPIEIALSYQRLIDEIQLTQEQMSDRVGKKRSTIANYLRLLKLDPVIQTGIRDGFITMGHGRAIINIDDHDAQADIYQKIVSRNLSVRETEALVKNYHESLNPSSEGNTASKSTSFAVADEEKKTFTNFFGAKVDVKVDGKGKGKITIPFTSEEDFNRIIKLIQG